jgi:hypothetical protein
LSPWRFTARRTEDTRPLIGGGYHTTADLIDNAVIALLTRPDQLELITAGKASWDDVMEETLRALSPVEYMPLRFAVEDIELDGLTIARGEPILIAFGGAGRDPELHGDTAPRHRRVPGNPSTSRRDPEELACMGRLHAPSHHNGLRHRHSVLLDGLTGLWEASLDARRALSPGSPVAVLDRLLRQRAGGAAG